VGIDEERDMAEEENDRVVLDLRQLSKGIPALTAAMGAVHAQNAAVCLENQGHDQSCQLAVPADQERKYWLRRHRVTKQMRRAYADSREATDRGACGIAILVVREMTGLTVLERAVIGNGIDYWLAPEGDDSELPFQRTARLEVSGILHGTDADITTRKKQKRKQTEQSDGTGLPAYAVVVEFSRPVVEVEKR
jgi:hypothetical protein